MSNFARGSEWRKWDLHLHTPSSFDYHNKSITNEDFINILITNEIVAVAITDHHNIDVARIKDLKRIAGDRLTIFPGIEFRTELGGSDSVHLIGIFPENCDIDDIWARLSVNLNVTVKDVERIGDERIYVDFREASACIHQLGGLISAHAGSKTNGLKEISNSELFKQEMKTDLVKTCIDILEISKPKDEMEYKKIVFKAINVNRPLVICSDNHNVNEYPQLITWIKADPTFEGLKQITYEPESRVCISEVRPDITRNNYQIIKSIKITHEHFSSEEIALNPNLNTIIGGRSCGKSLLLGIIAKLCGYTKPIKENEKKSTDTSLTYDDYIGKIKEKSIILWNDGKENQNRKIDFYSQTAISNLKDDNEEIKQRLKGILESQSDKAKTSFSTLESKISDNRKEIVRNVENLQSDLKKIRELDAVLKNDNNADIQSELDKVNAEIKVFREKNSVEFTEEQDDLFKQQENKLNTSSETIGIIKEDISILNWLLDYEIVKSSLDYNISLSEDNKKEVDSLFESIRSEAVEKWEKGIRTLIDYAENGVDDLFKLQKTIEETKEFKEGIEFYKSNEVLKGLTKKQDDLSKKLENRKKLEIDLGEYTKSTKQKANDVILLQKNYQTIISDSFGDVTAERSGIKISISVECDQSFVENVIITKLDNRVKVNQDLINSYKQDMNLETLIKNIYKYYETNSLKLTQSVSEDSYVKDVLSTNYYRYKLDIENNGDKFSEMSEGKKAFVILKLLLDFSDDTCPILIDQPEDELDNRSIYNELSKYLREKKSKRQVIVVTHNPNIVVGADAEEVIVANQHGVGTENKNEVKFDYKTGSLENTYTNPDTENTLDKMGIKEHVCDILEGGKEAFEKRENKFGRS